MQAKEAAKEEEETSGMTEEQKEERAKKRFAEVVQKLQNSKERNIVDFLQYQQLKEQIAAFENKNGEESAAAAENPEAKK